MKNKLILFFLLASMSIISAQTNLSLALKYQIIGTPTIVGNSLIVGGIVNDENGTLDASHVAIGDSLFYLGLRNDGTTDHTTIFAFAITSINTVSGTSLNITIESIEPFITTSVDGNISGQVAISRKNDAGFCAAPSGLNEPLKWAMENRFKKQVGGSVTYTNGLTKLGSNVKLGGTLTEATIIDGVSFPLTLSNLGATNISTDNLGSAKSSIVLPKFLSQPLVFTHELTSNSLNNAKLELRGSAFSRLIINDASGGFTSVIAAPNGVGSIANSQGFSVGVEQDGVYAKNVSAQTTEENQLYIDATTGKLAQKLAKPTFVSKNIGLNWTIASGSTLSTTPFTTGFLGAEIGDFVIISAVPDDNDLTDVIAKAWVSATNQISYQIENKRSTPIVFTNKVIYINIIKK